MAEYRYVATNLTDLHRDPSWLSELLTQVLNGVRLEILEEKEKWVRVRQDDGYEGWAYGPYLTTSSPAKPTHIVGVQSATLIEDDQGPVGRLLPGTHVHITDLRDHFARVQLTGGMIRQGWVSLSLLRPLDLLPLSASISREQIIKDARLLTGVYYLWGGSTPFGIDCSGLAQLTYRLSGHSIPRDARLQFPAGKPVEMPCQPGDLLFFHSETDRSKITHVGISTGGWRMIHSSRARNGVYGEDVQANPALRSTFAGARQFLF